MSYIDFLCIVCWEFFTKRFALRCARNLLSAYHYLSTLRFPLYWKQMFFQFFEGAKFL